jgi:sugar/nucleoside kinase (ribokinase family)
LLRLLKKIDILCINDSEARQLSQKDSIPAAAEWVLEKGPARVIVKRGEHGCSMYSRRSSFSLPACPVRKPVDPTGAGDAFAGGVMGYLALRRKLDENVLRQSLVFGSVMASFCVEGFSVSAMHRIKREGVLRRCRELHRSTQFPPIRFGRKR